MIEKIKKVYEEHYKTLMWIPILMVVLALVQIISQYAITGDFVHKGVSLKGGSTITITKGLSLPASELEGFLRGKFPTLDVDVRTMSSAGRVSGITVDSGAQDTPTIDSVIAALHEKVDFKEGEYSIEVVGSSLGNNFFKQTIIALLVSFLVMGTVVMLYFRIMVPSLAVILAAFSDITVTLAIFNLTGMKLSTAGVAAFLMLIGYSVDTDVVLTTRLLKRHDGTVMSRIYGSIQTGWMMTLTAWMAVTVAMFFVQSEVIKQIMIIIFIGLFVDNIMTWIQNVVILRLYIDHKNKKRIS